MTRFSITLQQGVDFVIESFKNMVGEIFVPKIPSYKILDVKNAIAPQASVKLIGIRPGEKLHEEMITISDSLSTIELENISSYTMTLFLTKEKFDKANNVKSKACEYLFLQ